MNNSMNGAETFAEFSEECREHLSTLENGLLSLEQKADSSPELVASLFRAMHSLKGAASFMGMQKVVDLSHICENLLSCIREGELVPDGEMVDTMLKTCDCLASLLEDPEAVSHDQVQALVSTLEGYHPASANSASRAAATEDSTPAASLDLHPAAPDGSPFTTVIPAAVPAGLDLSALLAEAGNNHLYLLRYPLAKLKEIIEGSLENFLADLASLGHLITLRTSQTDAWKHIDEVDFSTCGDMIEVILSTPLSLDFLPNVVCLPEDEIAILTADSTQSPSESPVAQTKDATAAGVEAQQPALPLASAQPAGGDFAHEANEATVQAVGDGNPLATPVARSIRINVDLMDTVMSLAGELVLVRNQQLSYQDQVDGRMRDHIQRLDSVTSQLQESIMLTRMQPIGNLFDKLPRIVRDLGRKLNKDIALELIGRDVELDKVILENLSDPFTHLIRNACDHGIERPEQRYAAGKPGTGTVVVRAFQEGGKINIEVRDDGGGIDRDRVKENAISKNLCTPAEAALMTPQQILNLVLTPGFSTAEEVTDLSGRGVGMDVVKSCIESLGGIISINSSFGRGTSFMLRLPLTLAIIPSLIVRSGGARFAIPQVSLEELVSVPTDGSRGKIEVAHNQEVLRLRDILLPLVRLDEVLARADEFTEATRREIIAATEAQRKPRAGEPISIAVVKRNGDHFGLIIDEIYETQEIVVKPVHGSLKRLTCFSGCTIMGDGGIAYILDIDGICTHADVVFTRPDEEFSPTLKEDQNPEDALEELHDLLLFECGPKECFALPLTLIRRIETVDQSEIQEIGGRSFFTRDNSSIFLLPLDRVLDVSSPDTYPKVMPVLIAKYLRRPVGIPICTIVDTIESQILFREDSYYEEGLLGSMVLNNRIVLFPDIFKLAEKAEPEWFGLEHRAVPYERKRRVLLVEDGSFFRHIEQRYLEDGGFEVVTAVNGRDALVQLSKHTFDIIVSDLVMPEMDGWSLAEEVRRQNIRPRLPMLALSSLQDEADRAKALRCGFDRYVSKLDRESFVDSVVEMLDSISSDEPVSIGGSEQA